MPTYFIDSEMTEASSVFLANKFQECLALLTSVKADIDNLTENGYKTQSSEKDFKPFVDQFNQSFEGTSQGLEGISKFVKGVGDAFTSTDDSLGQSLRG